MKLYILSIIVSLFWSFNFGPIKHLDKTNDPPQLISHRDQNASGPFFTKDHNQQPVLVWTEKLSGGEETGHVVKFATWDQKQSGFATPVEVISSKGCRTNDESMSKVAFKSDGTIVTVFSKRTPTAANKYAGALFYTQSFDGGNHWSDAQYLHVGDTTVGLSRSFFDLTTLADGEVGAIWLDSRLTSERGDGSSLFFSKTNGRDGFTEDKVIGTTTCECCRTELFVASNGAIHVIYRDIWQDSIRDMSHLISTNNGLTFSAPKRMSTDNWVINGCPHTGPAIAASNNVLHSTWFTMGGGQGLYYTTSVDGGSTFLPKKLLTRVGQHPQVLALPDNKVVFVWEERAGATFTPHTDHGASMENANHTDTNDSMTSYIKTQVWENGHPIHAHWVSLPEHIAEYPVVTALADGYIGISWVQMIGEDGYGVYFRKVEL